MQGKNKQNINGEALARMYRSEITRVTFADSGGEPVSVATTLTLYTDWASKSSAAAATDSWPVFGSIVKIGETGCNENSIRCTAKGRSTS